MARRRLNTRFLIVTASIVGLAGGVGLVLYKNERPRNPQPFIATADINMQKHEWGKAIANYGVAVSLLPQDDSVHLKLGKAYYEARYSGRDNIDSAIAEFTRVIELKPDSKDAWAGLLESNQFYVENMETHPTAVPNPNLPKYVNLARESAEHLVKLDPDNVLAQAAGPTLIIRVWLLNLAMPESSADRSDPNAEPLTPDQMADRAVADLSKLMQSHPENEKIPYWIARAKIYQGQQALKTDHPENATPLFSEAAGEFESSILARPDVVGLYINKAAILGMLQTSDPNPQAWQDYRRKQHDALDVAQQKADPQNDQQYKLAKQQWAVNLSETDPKAAELVFKDLIARYPDELNFRVTLARLLQHQPDRRADAIAILNEVSSLPGPSVADIQQRAYWDGMVSYCKLVRADIETDELPFLPTGKARTDLVTDIQNSIESAKLHYDGTSALLRIQGNFQLVDGQTRDAIMTLTKAADKMTQESGNVDPDLLRLEAKAYRNGQQTGKAIELLLKAMKDSNGSNNPEFMGTLAMLYLENQDYANAKPYIDWLAARFPGDPQTLTLQIRQLGPNADWAAVKPFYDKLPEQTPDQLALKFSVASTLANRDESIRVKTLIQQADPGNVRETAALLQLLVAANRGDDAKKVLADATKIHPDDPTLKVFKDLLVNNATGAQIDQSELTVIMDTADAFQREGKLAEFYRLKENPEEEMDHLKKQLELQPDNVGVLQTVFIRHMDAKRFADAEAMIPHMAELHADDADGLMLKCKLALARQDVPNALIYSRQMTHDMPQFAGSWEMYGEALRDSGQLDSACEQFNTAISLQATNIDSWKNLIQCSERQGKLQDAKDYIDKAITRFPGDPAYRDMRVQYEILYGNPESVLQELSDTVQQHPEDPRNYGMLANAQLACMRARSQAGQSDAASQFLAQAQDTFHKAVTHWPDDLRFANGLSQMLVQTGDFTGAEDCLKAISERPHWKGQPAPLILLGKVYLANNKPDLAETALHQALDADARSVDGHLVLADCLITQQKYDDALAVLQPATSDFRVRAKYTDLLIALGRGPQAEVELEDAIKANPTNIALTNLLLYVYDAEGEYDRGIRAANDAVTADPHNILVYLWRGKMEGSIQNPDLDVALKDLTYFRDSVPTSVEGRIALAQVLDIRRDRDGAIHELEAALQFDAGNRKTRALLLNDYLTATPSRAVDANRLLTQTLAMSQFAHDPQFEASAAMLWAKTDPQKAVATMQDAMQHTANKTDLTHSYFDVLLQTNDPQNVYATLLLKESDQYVSDPKTSWFVFNDRGIAKARLDDPDGATAEFTTAMDRAGTLPGHDADEAVAASICQAKGLGLDKALGMVVPRAQNSVTWKLVGVNLYIAKGDMQAGMTMAEAALTSESSLTPADQFLLYRRTSELYLNATPPMIDKAVLIYQKMLAAKPDDVEALNDMACVLCDMVTPAQPQKALDYSQRAFNASQKSGRLNPRVYDTQGWVLVLNNKVEDGIDIMHRTIDQADFPEAHYHLAYAYFQKQFLQEALEQLNFASDMIQAQEKADQHVDPVLKDKIDVMRKQIDDVVGVNSRPRRGHKSNNCGSPDKNFSCKAPGCVILEGRIGVFVEIAMWGLQIDDLVPSELNVLERK